MGEAEKAIFEMAFGTVAARISADRDIWLIHDQAF
jgi:hypothetical protein